MRAMLLTMRDGRCTLISSESADLEKEGASDGRLHSPPLPRARLVHPQRVQPDDGSADQTRAERVGLPGPGRPWPQERRVADHTGEPSDLRRSALPGGPP